MVKRGEIWLVNLDPTVGSEIRKSRPCVVVLPSELNDHLRKAIVTPMTSKSRPAPFRVSVTRAGQSNGHDVSCEQDEPAPGRIFVQSEPIGLKWNLLTGGWNLGAAVFLPRDGTAAICYSGQEDQK